MKANGWNGADKLAAGANQIAPTIVGGSKKHEDSDFRLTRARKARAQLGVTSAGVANEAPAEDFEGMPKLTARMIARVQGFHDEWDFSNKKSKVCRMTGNAFPPSVAKVVGIQIIKILENDEQINE